MDIIISITSNVPIYEQILLQIKKNIMNGTIKEGEALPSMRMLAKELRVSIITTKRAYEELEREGFIVTTVGKGSFVAKRNLELIKKEKLNQIRELIQQAVKLAETNNIPMHELVRILTEAYGGEKYEK